VIDNDVWVGALEHRDAQRIVSLELADQLLEFEDGVWVLKVDGRIAKTDSPVRCVTFLMVTRLLFQSLFFFVLALSNSLDSAFA